MELFKLHAKLTSKEKDSLKYLTISLFLVLVYQTYHLLLSLRMMLITDLVILLIGILGCANLNNYCKLSKYARCFLLLIPYFIIVGMMYGESIMSSNNLSIVLEQDLRYVMLFFMGGLFASKTEMMISFHWLMKWLAIISIIFGVLGLLSFSFTAAVIQDRAGTWTSSYYYWWASCSCFAYWGYYALFTKHNRVLGLGVLLTYLILGALFVKRASLVNGVVILMVYTLFSHGNKVGTVIKVAFIVVLSVTLLYLLSPRLFSTITDAYSSRMESLQDTETLDRNEEAFAYFERASILQEIFGNGIGHYPRAVGYRDYNYQLNAIHIGWANILYKGGVLYAFFYLALIIQVIKKMFTFRKLNQYQKVCMGVAVSSLVSLLYEGSWTYSLDPVCISAPLFYLLSNNKNEIV